MSITRCALWVMLGVALVCTTPENSRARDAKMIIRTASQLSNNSHVRQHVQPFSTLYSVRAIHQLCSKELDISEPQKVFLKTRLNETSKNYTAAYVKAFEDYVGAPPDVFYANDVTKTLTEQSQAAHTKMQTFISQKGCHASQIRPLLSYMDKLQEHEKKLAAIPKKP